MINYIPQYRDYPKVPDVIYTPSSVYDNIANSVKNVTVRRCADDMVAWELDETTVLGIISCWGDIPTILKQLLLDFQVKRRKAVEFGVEYGYSTAALANYFEKVIGVDTFCGDLHCGSKNNHLEATRKNLTPYPNITLCQSDYRDYIKHNNETFDLIHVDIIHTYEDTYKCGEWAVNHAPVTIFHDTESFEEVKQACFDLSSNYGLVFANYKQSHGLGILYNPIMVDKVNNF